MAARPTEGPLSVRAGRANLRGEVENIGSVPIDSIILKVTDDGEVVHRNGTLIHVGGLSVGEKGTAEGLFDYNQFIDEHQTLRYRNGLEAEVWLMAVLPEGRRSETLGEYISWSDYLSRRTD